MFRYHFNFFFSNYINKHEAKAIKLGKPVVLEEFGISRDKNNHQANTPTNIRDKFYTSVFQRVAQSAHNKDKALRGVNFWAWGGEGRPTHPHGLWQPGDEFIGDPAHEYQGWYSVYDNDLSTTKIIKDFANQL